MSLPDGAALDTDGVAHRYFAFAFDGNKAWNQGSRKARLDLRLRIHDGDKSVDVSWTVPLEYRLDGFHQPRRRKAPCE